MRLRRWPGAPSTPVVYSRDLGCIPSSLCNTLDFSFFCVSNQRLIDARNPRTQGDPERRRPIKILVLTVLYVPCWSGLSYILVLTVLCVLKYGVMIDSGLVGCRGRNTRHEDVEESLTQSRISPSTQRILRQTFSTGWVLFYGEAASSLLSLSRCIFFFFFITLGLELSGTKVYEP